MPKYAIRYGGVRGKPRKLTLRTDSLVVRTHTRETLDQAPLAASSRRMVSELQNVLDFPAVGVTVLQAPTAARATRVRTMLKQDKECRFSGRVLFDDQLPVLYTENFFVKFDDDCGPRVCRALLESHGLRVKREVEYARNGYFAQALEGTGRKVFEVAGGLLREERVVYCHPELVQAQDLRGAFPQQWHLKAASINGASIKHHARVEQAWAYGRGEGATIAIIDDGVDIHHKEFASAGKIVAPRDAAARSSDPTPGDGDNHGTPCAGVACADGSHGASGVAPRAKLMPIRLAAGLGSQAEADAIAWAADHGADVVSCSWGPRDGPWWNPDHPLHRQVAALPDSTRLAIDYAVRKGRGGKGCVICWAAGNGGESVDNDGYASYEKVLAIAACNDRGKRSVYSDMGDAIWCAFPSNDPRGRTPGIWTTDRSGRVGRNPGSVAKGDLEGHYTNSFGGTSSATPGAAGVAALVIGRNPDLRWDEVRDILKRCCDKIDPTNGAYDSNGHSRLYGYGRLNAERAVKLAVPAQPSYTAVHTGIRDVPIRDFERSRLAVAVGDTRPIKSVRVDVEIEHTYVGDLTLTLVVPGRPKIVLRDQTGRGDDDISESYDAVNVPALAELAGESLAGTWKLEVKDHYKHDEGKIVKFSVRLGF